MKYFKALLLILLIMACSFGSMKGQTLKLIGGDIVNGALTGLALGGATMAIQNSGDWTPLRFALGAGILYGIGIGIYDLSIVPRGQRFYTSATFNSGHNSTIIVLLDTIYGAAAGAIIGCAISLVGNHSVVNGLQYGAGAGTWVGFGFGLIDSFVLAKGPRQLRASAIHPNNQKVGGIIKLATSSKKVAFGFIEPAIFSQKVWSGSNMVKKYSLGVNVFNVNVQF